MESSFHMKRLLFSGPFRTLKIVFCDLFIACCRLASEFNQGYSLLMAPETRNYGIATFIVSWIPGIAFAIYILSIYRRQTAWPWYKTLFLASCSVLLYPIVPIFSILYFLWTKPEETYSKNLTKEETWNEQKMAKEAKIRLRTVQGIHGGIAAPLQLCYQLWLVINGILTIADNGIIFSSIKLKDWEGNEVLIPTAAPICIFFTCITITKTTWNINSLTLPRVTNWNSFWEYIVFGLKLMPFSISVTYFRIWSMTFMIIYLNQMGFIPLLFFWIVNVAISHRFLTVTKISKKTGIKNSVWLMSFMGIFIPAFFRTNYQQNYEAHFASKQHKLLRTQCIWSFAIYIPALLACAMIVNLPNDFMYGSYNELENDRFNVCIGLVIFEGFISTFLSFSSNWSGTIRRPKSNNSMVEKKKKVTLTSKKQENKNSMSKINELTSNCHTPIEKVKPKSENNKTSEKRYKKVKKFDRSANMKHEKGIGKNMNSKKSISEHVLHIAGILVILCFSLYPILSCFRLVVFSPSCKERSYLYFKGNSTNESILIETIRIPELDTVKGLERFLLTLAEYCSSRSGNATLLSKQKISGTARFVKNINLRSTFSGQVLVVDSQIWEKRTKQRMGEDRNAAAIVLLNPPNFRPSSPIRDIPRLEGKNSPDIFLIRNENADQFRHYVKANTEIRIIMERVNVPEPLWECDLPKSGCLKDNYKDGFIDGKEYISIKCFYGNRTCFGFQNRQQYHNFCSGPNTKVCPLDRNGFSFTKKVLINNIERSFKCSPVHCTPKSLSESIPMCDAGLQGGMTSGWTNIIGKETKEVDLTQIATMEGRSYCSLKNVNTGETEMIFEEQVKHRCCREYGICGNTVNMCLEQLHSNMV